MPLFRPGKPHWRLGFDTTTSQAAGNQTIQWGVILEEDPADLWSSGLPSTVVLDRSGLYLMVLEVGRAAVASAASISARLRRNGGGLTGSGFGISTTAANQITTTWLGELTEGDALTCEATLHGSLTADYQTGLTWWAGARVGPVRWT